MLDYSFQSTVLEEGEIRLLSLHGGDAQEELVGNLEVVKITADAIPHYDSLSYTWGDHEPSEHIKIIHSNQQYCIRIRPNLHQALRHLRFHRNNRYLWVDAICINQENEREKSSQVRMMSLIYNNSSSVCVWVGPEMDESRRAINFIKSRLVHEEADRLLEQQAYRHEWLALSRLMRRPWFSRRWIIQEIAMAKTATLHCGTDWLPWDIFAEAVMLFTWGQSKVHNALRASPDCNSNSLGDIRESAAARLIQAQDNIFRKSKDGQLLEKLMSLEDLLCRFSASEALDPRDSIYALLSIARDASAGFPASSTREVTPEYLQDPSTGMFFESPASLETHGDGNGFTWLVEETTNSELAHFQATTHRKRAVSNSDTNVPDGNSRQTKRIYTDIAPGLPNGSGIINSDDARALETPTIRISTFLHTAEINQVSPTAPNGSESFPKLGDTNVTAPQAPALVAPAQEESLHTFLASAGSRNFVDGPIQNHDRHVDEQGMTWLQVPQRKRGNSSASISSIMTEKYLQQTEGIRRTQTMEYPIPVNYGSPIPEVCKHVMSYALSKTRSLNMICRPWAPRVAKGVSLPSWIQPVTKSAFGPTQNGTYTRINADPLVGQPAHGHCFYNATPNVLAKWKIDANGKDILTVHGFILDEIDRKAPPANAGVIPVEWNEIADWEDTSMTPPDAFWRTLVGNRDDLGQQPLKLWRRACHLAFGMKPRDGPLNVEKALEEASSFVREYLEKVLRTTCSRRLSISKNGLWALVPAKTKKGDKLCIINGCSVPIILRQVFSSATPGTTTDNASSNDHGSSKPMSCQKEECQTTGECKCKKSSLGDDKLFEMIGECYIHGMMDGEALLYQHKNEIGTCAFNIK